MDKQDEILLTSEEITQLLDGRLFWIDIQEQRAKKDIIKTFPKFISETNAEYSIDTNQSLGKSDLDQASLNKEQPESEESPVVNEVSPLYEEQQKFKFEHEDDEIKLGLDLLFTEVNSNVEHDLPRLEGRFVVGLISGIGLLTVFSWIYYVFLV